MNSIVVTVLYLLRALNRRIIVYRILSKIHKLDDEHKRVCLSWNFKLNDIARPIYVNKQPLNWNSTPVGTNLGIFIEVHPTGLLSTWNYICNIRGCLLAITHRRCCYQLLKRSERSACCHTTVGPGALANQIVSFPFCATHLWRVQWDCNANG